MDIKEILKNQLKDGNIQMFHIEGDIWLVPCVSHYQQNEFKPLLKPLTNEKPKQILESKQGWSQIEDDLLLKIVSNRGAKAWSSIAKEINAMVHNSLCIRQGRHCRERWYNHVDPDLKKGGWTEHEDEKLLKLHSELGNKWSEIAKSMPGRNENTVKNRFNSIGKKKKTGIESQTVENYFNQAEMDIQPCLFGYDTLMLMSPKIVNFDICENSPKVDFSVPKMIRPISSKPPSATQIQKAKRSLQNNLFECSASPSEFLHLLNS